MSTDLVHIIGMDPDRSFPSGEGALVDIHLKISQPPSGWISIFDTLWQQKLYMIKRRAHATSGHIIIRCMPEELQKDHIPMLKEVIAETNQAYATAVEQKNKRDQAAQAREGEFKSQMDKLADDLDV